MITLARLGWIVFGAVTNLVAAGFGAWWVISTALTGFTASQQTLSAQMNTLQGSLNEVATLTDTKLAEARGNLTSEIATLSTSIRDLNSNLGTRLEQNSAQLASLNATLSGMDKRLNDTIARQEKVEAVLLRQRILYSPPDNKFEGKFATEWASTGVDVSALANYDDTQAISDWLKLAGFNK